MASILDESPGKRKVFPDPADRSLCHRRCREFESRLEDPTIDSYESIADTTDRPFAEAKEAIGGYWIIQVRSREETLEWARRAPMANNEIIEVRQIYERADFSIVVQKEAVQKAAEGFEEHSNAAAAKA